MLFFKNSFFKRIVSRLLAFSYRKIRLAKWLNLCLSTVHYTHFNVVFERSKRLESYKKCIFLKIILTVYKPASQKSFQEGIKNLGLTAQP